MANERLDAWLVASGLASGRDKACERIRGGEVTVNGAVVCKPAYRVAETDEVSCTAKDAFVGRGGLKLEHALSLTEPLPAGCTAMDVGASTGGFTDCLLRRGAARVYAIDSGSGQLAASLREDSRVVNMEKCNARYLDADMLDADFGAHGGADAVVMDVSFISQTCILPVLPPLLREGGRIVTLIKPQFEVGREGIGKGGIVREDKWRRTAIERVLTGAALVGLSPLDVIRSPIEGGDGNVEYLGCFALSDATRAKTDAQALLARMSSDLFRK